MDLWTNRTALELILFSSSGGCALVTTLLASLLVHAHLTYYVDALAQTYIIRILFMPVLYALTSMFSILFVRYIVYFQFVRDCYEAFVLYQFFALLLHYFNTEACIQQDEQEMGEFSLATESASDSGENESPSYISTISASHREVDETTGSYLSRMGHVTLPFPLKCYPPFVAGDRFLVYIRRIVFQYVLLKPLMAFVAIILEYFGLYHRGSYNPRYGYLWLTAILNVSISVAFYGLYVFYHITHHHIKIYHPLSKLLAVKAAIFFTFWQAAGISALYEFQIVGPLTPELNADDSAAIMNNTLIGGEMVLLAIFNMIVFPYQEYKNMLITAPKTERPEGEEEEEEERNLSIWSRLTRHILNPFDVCADGKAILMGHDSRVT